MARRREVVRPVDMPQDRPPVAIPFGLKRVNPPFSPLTVVDVIIPVSPKHRSAFPTAVRSVERQTLPAPYWRIITINDSDEPLPVPREDIYLIDNFGRHGSSYARNLGLKAARAPFVCFLDADDWLINTSLELLLKGYILLDTGYIYGDSYMMNADGTNRYYAPPTYDQQAYLKGNIHNVTALIPTDLAKDCMFDESMNLWEDYDFYMHMAAKGYCGARIPYPLIIYNQHTGQNRDNAHALEASGEHLSQQIKDKYKSALEGRPRMSCCGGSKEQAQKARETLNKAIGTAGSGDVHMEWMGQNAGSVMYRSPNVQGRAYNVGAIDPYRFFAVDPRDVEWMQSLGARIVPKPSVPMVLPTAGEFTTAQPIAGPSVRIGSEVSVVVPQGVDEDFEELKVR